MTMGSPRARFSDSLRRVTGLRSWGWKRGSRGGEDTDGSFRVGAPAIRGRRPLDEAAGLLERVRVDHGEVLRGDAVGVEHGPTGLQALLRRGTERGAEPHRLRALGRAEARVAARHGEAVGLPDRR